MFKKMSICRECLDKRVKEISRFPWPKQEAGMPVKEYFELFQICCLAVSLPLDTGIVRDLFVRGLTVENEEEYVKSCIFSSRPVDKDYLTDLVDYLSFVEEYKKNLEALKRSKIKQ